MAVIKDSTATNSMDVDGQGAALVRLGSPKITVATGGRYRFVGQTGLATVLSAFTATAGHWGGFRWGSATKTALVDSITISCCMVTDFTNFCQLRLACRMARSYTASHTGGTTATLTGNNCKLRTSYATTALTAAQVSTTADLTAGTHTIDTQPILTLPTTQKSDGATIAKNTHSITLDLRNGPIVLAQDEGFVFSNEILMSAAGTASLAYAVEWREYLNADVPTNV